MIVWTCLTVSISIAIFAMRLGLPKNAVKALIYSFQVLGIKGELLAPLDLRFVNVSSDLHQSTAWCNWLYRGRGCAGGWIHISTDTRRKEYLLTTRGRQCEASTRDGGREPRSMCVVSTFSRLGNNPFPRLRVWSRELGSVLSSCVNPLVLHTG